MLEALFKVNDIGFQKECFTRVLLVIYNDPLLSQGCAIYSRKVDDSCSVSQWFLEMGPSVLLTLSGICI